MPYLKIIIVIVFFMLLQGTFFSLVSADTSLQQMNLSLDKNEISSLNFSNSALTADNGSPHSKIGNALKIMFSFGINAQNFPVGFAVFISIINWLITLVMLVCAYRLLNPLA
jgi:hypothetical protein